MLETESNGTYVLCVSRPLPPITEAIVQALSLASTEGKKFAMASAQGVGPGTDAQQWQALFAGARP